MKEDNFDDKENYYVSINKYEKLEEENENHEHKDNDENRFLIKNVEREEKDKTKRLEKILSRLDSKIRNSKGKSYDEIYKKFYYPEDILKREMIHKINKCHKVSFYILIFLIGSYSIFATFLSLSIKNSLLDLLITSGKIYYEIGNENNTDYRPLKFHEYYYNQTYSDALDLNINLISILNIIGNLPLKAWGFSISYFFFSCFSGISLLMIYYIEYDEKTLLKPKISTFELIYTIIAYIFLLIGTGCSSLMSQQIIIEYYFKFQKIILKNKINEEQDNSPENIINSNSSNQNGINSEELNKTDSDKTKENPINIMFIFLIIGFLTVFGFYGSHYYKISFKLSQDTKNISGNIFKSFFQQNILFLLGFVGITILLNIIFMFVFTKNFCQCSCGNEEIKFEDEYKVYKIFGYTIYSETIKNNDNQNTENKCCKYSKLTLKCIKNCCDSIICNSLDICKETEENHKCCCCCCCEFSEEEYELDEVSFCYIYKSERHCHWLSEFLSNKIQKEMSPYILIYFLLRLSTIDLEEKYKNNKKIFDNNVDSEYWFLIILLLAHLVQFFILFYYITYSLSLLSKYISSKSLNNKQSEISQGKSVLNSILGIILFNSIFSLYLSLNGEKNNSNSFNSFYINNRIILIPLSLNKFFYLAVSFYASRNLDTDGTGQKISSSILISIYISIIDFCIYFLPKYLNSDLTLYYIQISASILSLAFSIILILKLICLACLRRDFKFFIYLLYFITFLGPCSNCISEKCCDYNDGKCICICCNSKKNSI